MNWNLFGAFVTTEGVSLAEGLLGIEFTFQFETCTDRSTSYFAIIPGVDIVVENRPTDCFGVCSESYPLEINPLYMIVRCYTKAHESIELIDDWFGWRDKFWNRFINNL